MCDLAQRLAAHPRWRWMPGMAWIRKSDALCGFILTDWDSVDEGGCVFRTLGGIVPDLDHPATIGWMLHLARDAWDDRTMHPFHGVIGGVGRWWLDSSRFRSAEFDSESEALAHAILHAWSAL